MIVSATLLKDLKRLLKVLQDDLCERAESGHTWGVRLREQHRAATEQGRTGRPWIDFRDGEVDQAAVAWLVATTFIRFCEDNDLLAGARLDGRSVPALWLAGPNGRTKLAVENQTEFFRAHPALTRRDWLQQAFRVLAAQPAGTTLVHPDHNPVWTAEVSAETAEALTDFWRAEHDDGTLVHDFTDPDLDTRFLGDLYQDLSEHAKKTYALLQTPEFVEEFILGRTLSPALDEFGLEGFRLIDPTCGSGHFLLGAFEELDRRWAAKAPGLDRRERARRAMDAIHGVDLNPFAIAIARFRLTVAGMKAAGYRSLVETEQFPFHLAVGDSLLGGRVGKAGERVGRGVVQELDLLGADGDGAERADDSFHYDTEDIAEYDDILEPGTYHAVVGNPPYITVKDKALNALYRQYYSTAHRKYALSVPFMERFFELAVRAEAGQGAGYVGEITANSFMKREFGKKLIEDLFAGYVQGNPVDLTDVIDTSGAYIPGHGTPTVILVGRRRPHHDRGTVNAVLGVRGEPGQPADPALGLVWSEIVAHVDDHGGYDGTYVTVADLSREALARHPWSLSGGAASDVMEVVDAQGSRSLGSEVLRIGFFGVVGADEAFVVTPDVPARLDAVSSFRELTVGDEVRDFDFAPGDAVFFPYSETHDLDPLENHPRVAEAFWKVRTELGNRATFSKNTYFEEGRPWYEWHQMPRDSGAHRWAIAFVEVATHNHFVLDRSGRVFKQTAPVIKLPDEASEKQHLELLGVLNSSTACFRLKQVSQDKGNGGIGGGIGDEAWERRFQFGATKIQDFPLPVNLPLERGRTLDSLARDLQQVTPASVVERWQEQPPGTLVAALVEAERSAAAIRARMIFEQEELDWEVYRLYGLIDEDLTYSPTGGEPVEQIVLGQRAFEIALARRVSAGEEETAWFDRHSSTPVTELLADWPDDYRALVNRRLDLIANDKSINLLERPEYKRRWAATPWAKQRDDALKSAILDRLEDRDLWFDGLGPVTRSVGELADAVRHDEFVNQAVAILVGAQEFALADVLADLLKDQPVPFLAAYRCKEPGVEKYRQWQEVWDLQRHEDAGEKVEIPVPPKYQPTDFRGHHWTHRGKLDVPKERFVGYPGVARAGDRTAVLGWAGWDHAEQARALAREFQAMRGAGAEPADLLPLLAGLDELQPWLEQWHHDIDPQFGMSPSSAIRGLVDAELLRLNATREDLTVWRPPAARRGKGRA